MLFSPGFFEMKQNLFIKKMFKILIIPEAATKGVS